MITSMFLHFSLFSFLFPSATITGNPKKQYIFVETFSPFILFDTFAMKNDRTFINGYWNWHIDGVLQGRERNVVLLMRQRREPFKSSLLLRNDQVNKTFHSLSLWSRNEL